MYGCINQRSGEALEVGILGASRKLGSLRPALTISLSKHLTHVSTPAVVIHPSEEEAKTNCSFLVYRYAPPLNHSRTNYCKKQMFPKLQDISKSDWLPDSIFEEAQQ